MFLRARKVFAGSPTYWSNDAAIQNNSGKEIQAELHKRRQVLGYYLLLDLEFIIAAEIIDTLMKPTSQDLIIPGAIVAIRTVIRYALNAELSHQTQSLKGIAAP